MTLTDNVECDECLLSLWDIIYVEVVIQAPPPQQDDDEDEDHGGLVKKMLETKKELESGSQVKKTEIVSE